MKFIEEYYDKSTNQYVYNFEATQEEYDSIQEYCKKQNKTLDTLVEEFLKDFIEKNKNLDNFANEFLNESNELNQREEV